jgi:hypothetical protein
VLGIAIVYAMYPNAPTNPINTAKKNSFCMARFFHTNLAKLLPFHVLRFTYYEAQNVKWKSNWFQLRMKCL